MEEPSPSTLREPQCDAGSGTGGEPSAGALSPWKGKPSAKAFNPWKAEPSAGAFSPWKAEPSAHSRLIHSRINPLLEAKRLLQAKALSNNNRWVFLPADLLYSLEEALSLSPPPRDLRVVLYYENLRHFVTCWSLRQYAFLPSLSFAVNIPGVWEMEDEDLDIASIKGNYFIHNIAYRQSKHQFIEENKRAYYQRISDWYSSKLTQFYFAKKWILNGLLNLKSHRFKSLNSLKNKGRRGACHIVGAGPSLEKGIAYLKNGDPILCLDTALMPLLLRGVEPDFVIALDSGYANSLDFERLPGPNCSLIADISTHPAMFRHFSGEKYLFVASEDRG